MKKPVLLFTFSIIMISLSFAATTTTTYSTPFSQYILGYVGKSTTFNISLIENVLPFNIDSETIKSNEPSAGSSEPAQVKGLRIGTYLVVSNDSNMNITITHDKLTHYTDETDPNKVGEADYRLYFFTQGSEFKSCTSSGSINLTQADYSDAGEGDDFLLSLAERSIYLTLTDSDTDNLLPGQYQSTITVTITQEE